MKVLLLDIAPEYLTDAIESAMAQGWDLVSAAAHNVPGPEMYHCMFAAQDSRDVDAPELDLEAYVRS